MRFFLARNPKLAKDILRSTRICKQNGSFPSANRFGYSVGFVARIAVSFSATGVTWCQSVAIFPANNTQTQ